MKYDVIIIGAGPGGIFSAYELTKKSPELKIAVLRQGILLPSAAVPSTATKLKPASAVKPALS